MSEALQQSPEGPNANTIGSPFIELQSVDSTNNYARQQIHAGLAQHGMALFAHEQLSGRGQRGRVWTSEKDMNIALSILIKPGPLQLSRQFQLSACVALSVHTLLTKYAIGNVFIKWPNDLYWQDRKAGGILIESLIGNQASGAGSAVPEWTWAIAGIGINVNQTAFPAFLPNPVSLKQITGRDFEPVVLARELCGIFGEYYQELVNGDFENIYRLYHLHLYKRNETVKLKKDNRTFDVLVKGVSRAGKLITRHAFEEEFDFNQVEWVL